MVGPKNAKVSGQRI
ncbi:Protein of unkwown function [Propionibacterium freudenreichii]|nr:Protein of unkwown function [Propionibacterium freudenreichii]